MRLTSHGISCPQQTQNKSSPEKKKHVLAWLGTIPGSKSLLRNLRCLQPLRTSHGPQKTSKSVCTSHRQSGSLRTQQSSFSCMNFISMPQLHIRTHTSYSSLRFIFMLSDAETKQSSERLFAHHSDAVKAIKASTPMSDVCITL